MINRSVATFTSFILRRGVTCIPRSSVIVSAVAPTTSSVQSFSTSLALARSKFRHSRHHIPALFELWRRREEVGPEKPKHRSESPNWNYEAELYGFCKRLNEEWTRETLIEAFTEKAYADAEESRRSKLSAKTNSADVQDDSDTTAPRADSVVSSNVALAARGEKLCRDFISAYLRHSLPAYPEDGIKAVCNFLVSDDLLAYVCKNIGTSDLILSTEFPPTVAVFANVMKALIGGLERDQGSERTYRFIHDFIVTQLSGRDINQFWEIPNPMGLLAETMKKRTGNGTSKGSGEPESRIIWQTGVSTPLAAYKVGIYDAESKELLGEGGGETVLIAEQMAAVDALHKMFGTYDWKLPFEFGRDARLTDFAGKINAQ